MIDKSYIGKGEWYMGLYAGGPLVSAGNCSQITLGATEEEKKLKDYRSAGGGDANVLKRIESVTLSIVAHDFNASNIATGLFGTASAVAAGAVVDEAQTTPADVSSDFLLPTDFAIDTTQTVSITGYNVNTDFTVTAAGVLVLASGNIPASTALAISYTKLDVDLVELLVNSGFEYKAVFVGLNEAQSNTPVIVRPYRFKFGPTESWELIGDDFGSITLSGVLLKDSSITTPGLSQYATVTLA